MSDDDESPWIDMDGNIKEKSPESKNKSPTSYSKPNTPEIDKLKSLMVSSPSTNSSISSISSISKNTDESFYDKLQEYYELKQEYDQKLRDAHRLWNNAKPPMSLEKKQEKYQDFIMKRKCINCGNGPGGTIFSHVGVGQSRKIIAMCGCEERCNLNIEIYMGQSAYLPEYLDYYTQQVEELKKELTEYKLDLLFNLRDEEIVLGEFRTIKEQLTENLDQLVQYKQAFDMQNENIELDIQGIPFRIFNDLGEEIKANEDGEYIVNRKKYIQVMQKYLNNLISEFKTKTNEYKKTPSQAKLKENFDFLQDNVLKIQKSIRDEKYHTIYMDTIENNAKKGFKKQKIMDTFVFNPSKYSLDNQIVTFGRKITEFKR
tara:strand:- start:5558 stop:6676 length:1119 start_codon:yes stop_codon:yes gene_type:complete